MTRFNIPETATGIFNFPNGTVKHYEKGKKQGLVTLPDGTKKYYHNNTLHRDGHPAIIYPNGKTEWYLHGVHIATIWYTEPYREHYYNIIHRDVIDGEAMTIHKFTTQIYKAYDSCNLGSDKYYYHVYAVNGNFIPHDNVRDVREKEIQKLIARLEKATSSDVMLCPRRNKSKK